MTGIVEEALGWKRGLNFAKPFLKIPASSTVGQIGRYVCRQQAAQYRVQVISACCYRIEYEKKEKREPW
ncbi:MAG: hypothetical protein KA972_07600 [Brachymonas sp.]|nr:hypothetical protein [Brachymonas sp.]